MSFHIHGSLRVHDLYLFIGSSLKRACEAYGVPEDKSKSEFKHSKVYSYESAEEHKVEVLEYLKLDVIALRELYRIYSKVSFKFVYLHIEHTVGPAGHSHSRYK